MAAITTFLLYFLYNNIDFNSVNLCLCVSLSLQILTNPSVRENGMFYLYLFFIITKAPVKKALATFTYAPILFVDIISSTPIEHV